MTEYNWQWRLDHIFPYGALVTQVDQIPTYLDNSTFFNVPRIEVAEDGTAPKCQMYAMQFDKWVNFVIADFEETTPGVFLVTTPGGKPNFVVSKVVGPQAKQAMLKCRHEMYGDA